MTEWKIMTNKTPKNVDRNNNKKEERIFVGRYQFGRAMQFSGPNKNT